MWRCSKAGPQKNRFYKAVEKDKLRRKEKLVKKREEKLAKKASNEEKGIPISGGLL